MAAPRVRRRGLTQRDRLTLTIMTLGTVLLVTALVLFDNLTPAPTEFGSVSPAAVAASDPTRAPGSTQPTGTPGSIAAVGAPAATPTPAAAPPAATTSPVGTSPATTPVAGPSGEPPSTPPTEPAAESAPPPVETPATSPPAAPAGIRPAVAQSVSIPVLGVTAPVLPVGSSDGVLDPPEDPAQVGFYTGSVLPGSTAGSTVLVGHVNYANVPGALIGLTRVAEGDTVEVATIGGQTVRYRITAREVFLKSEGLPADLFTTEGPARLVLITCGGPFDTVAQRYEDNVVVVATPET